MAKPPAGKGGTARIRLIVLDAEIPDGDVSQLTQALQNALKPPVIQQRSTPPAQLTQRPVAGGEPDEDVYDETTEPEDLDEQVPLSRPREAKPRKMPVPDMIDLDEASVTSLKECAAEKKPKTDLDKSLLAVAWFNDNGAEDGATTSHVYTCYKYVGWSIGKNKDFGAPLRALKRTDHLRSVDHGKYAVTPYGRTALKEMDTD